MFFNNSCKSLNEIQPKEVRFFLVNHIPKARCTYSFSKGD